MRHVQLLAPFAPAPPLSAALRRVGLAALHQLAHQRLADQGIHVADALSFTQACREAAVDLGLWSDPAGQARLAAGPLAELWRSGADLKPWCDASNAGRKLPELARLALGVEARLKALGMVPPPQALWLAAALQGPSEALLLEGPTHLQADELAFWNVVAAPGSMLRLCVGQASAYALPQANAKALAQLGWVVDELVADEGLHWAAMGRRISSHELPGDEESEALAAVALVQRALNDGMAPADVALAVRHKEAAWPRLWAAAQKMALPLAAEGPSTLAQSRVGGYLRLVATAIAQDGAFESTLLALAHPLGPGLSPLSPAGVRMRRPESWADWQALSLAVAPFIWPQEAQPLSEWLLRLQGIVDALPHSADLGDENLSVSLALAKALPQKLAQQAQQGLWSRSAFLAAWDEALSHCELPGIGASPACVQFLSFKQLSEAGPFSLVVALGTQEGAFPAPCVDPAALPMAQRKLWPPGAPPLADALSCLRQEQLLASSLLACAQQLHLLRPALLGKERTQPSAWLLQAGVEDSPLPPWEDPAWALARELNAPTTGDGGCLSNGQERRGHWPASMWEAAKEGHRVEARREALLPPDAHDGLLGHAVPTDTRSFSATQLLALGQCPFRWFMGFGLGLRAPEEPGGALDPTLRGNLYHKALERAVEQAMGKECDGALAFRQAVVAALPAAFLVAEAEEGIPAWPGWESLRAAHLRTLIRAVEAPDFLDEGAKPLGVEVPFEAQWRGLKVKGKLDRADEGPDGLVLIDYKTRATLPTGVQDAEGKATLDLQLPIYAEAAAASLGPKRPVADVRYLSLTKGKRLNPPGAIIDEGALAAFAARVHARFAVGAFPPAPDVQGKACGYCDHALACRKGSRLERRRAAGLLDPVAPMLPAAPKAWERRQGPPGPN